MTSRREFLTIAGASVLASGLSLDSAKAADGTNNQNDSQPSAPIPEAANRRGRFKLEHRFGLGGVAIGDGMKANSDGDCRASLRAAWDAGVPLYDTSPWYGFGLSERRFGNFLYITEAFWAELRDRRLISPSARTGYQQVTLRA